MLAVSLFAGAGGFEIGMQRAGIQTVLQAECDPTCLSVLARHYPNVERIDDVCKVNATRSGVDLVYGGFPCQDVSVAGARAGLGGERSGLWFEFERIIRELRPPYVVVENVLGLLSSSNGDDLRLILDQLLDNGYVTDIDICDARYFGVPQRRKRVLLVCTHVTRLLKQKTTRSERVIGQLLCESLLCSLVSARAPYSIGPLGLASPKWLSVAGLKKRMRLFEIASENDWQTLLKTWVDVSRKCQTERRDSASVGKNQPSSKSVATATSASMKARPDADGSNGSTSRLWSDTWAVLSYALNSSTTSTPTKPITESQIFGCALTVLLIFEHTVRLNACSQCFSNEESSISTVLRAFTDYARSASSDLFGELGWVQQWWDFRERAEGLLERLDYHIVGRAGDAARAAAVLAVCESCGGHPQTGGEEREDVAYALAASARGTGDQHGNAWNSTDGAGSIGAHHGNVRADQSWTDQLVAATLSGGSHPESNLPGRHHEDDDNLVIGSEIDEGMARPLVARATGYRMDVETENFVVADPIGTREGKTYTHEGSNNFRPHNLIADTLRVEYGEQSFRGDGADNLVAWDDRNQTAETDTHHTLRGAGLQWSDGVASAAGVRRLTPLECERLMGWPDDWTRWDVDGKEIPDSHRYRLCGNGVVATVAEWIGHRLVVVDGMP